MKKNKKSVTIGDLAVMVAKGFERTGEKISDLENRITVFESETKESFKKARNDILDIGDKFVSKHEFNTFQVRFHRLEQKVAGKNGK